MLLSLVSQFLPGTTCKGGGKLATHKTTWPLFFFNIYCPEHFPLMFYPKYKALHREEVAHERFLY